jgi:sec-independent protein translocase protein TatC
MTQSDQLEDSAMPLIEHLAELRSRLIKSVIAFIIGMVICFTVWNPIFNFLTQPICSQLVERGQDCGLILIKLQEGFFVAIRISLLGGFILSFPYIGSQLWRFVAPGLYKNERNAFLPFLLASPIMFFIGAAFAFYVVIPLAFDFFLGFQQAGLAPVPVPVEGDVETAAETLGTAGITFQGSVAEYLSLTIKFILAFGLCFQLPVLLTLMGKAGLVSSEGLAHVRKYAVVAILVLAAIVTPPDIITQVILFVVVYGLYEISIQLVRRVERKREQELRAQGLWFEDDEDETPVPATASEATEDDEPAFEDDPLYDEFGEDEEEEYEDLSKPRTVDDENDWPEDPDDKKDEQK